MTRTKTFDLNTLRLSGKPIAYFDNTLKGRFDVSVIIDVGGTRFKISCSTDPKTKKPTFTEADFKGAKAVSFMDLTFGSYVSSTDNRPRFELKCSNTKQMLLGVDLKDNEAFVGGVVSLVNTQSRKIMIDVSYRKGFGAPKPGEKQEYGIRQIMIEIPEPLNLPSKGQEVIVKGSAMLSESNTVGIRARQVEIV